MNIFSLVVNIKKLRQAMLGGVFFIMNKEVLFFVHNCIRIACNHDFFVGLNDQNLDFR